MIISPVKDGFPITQGYGERPDFYSKLGDKYNVPLQSHDGLDIGTPLNTPLYAPIDGTVWFKKDPQGYGNYVVITGLPFNKAGEYREVLLAHLSSFHGLTGREVKAGDNVGYSGNTGLSSGSHLHFSMRRKQKDGTIINYNNNCGWEDIFEKGWILSHQISRY